MKKLFTALSFGLVCFSAIAESSEFTLYRTGIDVPVLSHDNTLRIGIATFDIRPFKSVEDNAKYNLQNCEFAKELFSANQPHYRGSTFETIRVNYWCEKGRFRK